MKKSKMCFISILLGFIFILATFPVTYAQGVSEEEFTLEEITVTAEKRETNVQKTAMEITAVTGSEIDSKAIGDVTKVLDGLAGVSTMGGAQGNKIFIRGIGSSLDTNMASPSVSLQKDNVYLGQGEAVSSTLYDIERVEVLYGPQGTLYGKNATGGTVNIITKNPTDEFETSANVTLGDYNMRNWNAVLNIPFSSKFAARVALDKQNHEGYVSDGSGAANKLATRVKLSYKPTDRFSILLTDEWTWDKSQKMNTVPVPGSAGNINTDRFVVPDVDGDGVADDFFDADGNRVYTDTEDGIGDGIMDIKQTGWVLPYGGDAWSNDIWHPAPKADYRYQLHSLQIDLDMGWSRLTLIPTVNKNYRSMHSDFITGIAEGTGHIMGAEAFRETQYTAEARLASSVESKLIWTLGAYWNKSNNRPTNEQYSDLMDQAAATWEEGSSGGGPPPMSFRGVGGSLAAFQPPPPSPVAPYTSDNPITQTIREPQDGYAIFGQATYPVTDRFRLTYGMRWNNEPSTTKYRIIIYDVSADGMYGTDTTAADYVTNLYDQTVEVQDSTASGGVRHMYDTGIVVHEVKKSPYSYTGGLEFDLAENNMLYATYKTSFKKGGLNLGSTTPPASFDPETVKAYTMGSKNRFMNNQLQVNAEAYYYDYDGYQVQCMTQIWDELTQSMRGAMLIINAEKGKNFGLDLNSDWMLTANDRISVTLAYMKTEFGELVLPGGNIGGSSEFVLTGTDLPNAPHWSGTLGYEHAFMLDSGASITPSVRTKISTGYWTTHEKYMAGAYQGAYRTSDFYITYRDASGKYGISLWGKNMENEAITQYAFPQYRKFIGDPRTTGITFSARF